MKLSEIEQKTVTKLMKYLDYAGEKMENFDSFMGMRLTFELVSPLENYLLRRIN